MKSKRSIILLAVLFLGMFAGLALFVPQVKAETEYENYTNNSTSYTIYNQGGTNGIQHSEAFTVGSTLHSVTSIYVYLMKTGSPVGNLTVSLRLTSGHLPIGSDLTSGQINSSTLTTSLAWYQISMTEYPLKANTEYAIVLNDTQDTSGSICPSWGANYTASGYSSGTFGTNNFGWSLNTAADGNYQVWGNSINASTYDVATVTSTNYNTNATFLTRWNDYFNVSGYIYGSNLTSSWINQTWTPFNNFYNSTSAWTITPF